MPIIEVKVPDIGDFSEVTVIEILVAPGDQVKQEQSLITVESDKASMEVPSTVSGTVKELKLNVGDKVSKGSLILMMETAEQGKQAADKPALQAAPTAAAPQQRVSIELRVPDIGDFKDVTVIEILAKVGEQITKEQSLITVESDKASAEIPASAAGILESLTVKVGDKVNIGDVIGMVKATAGAAAPSPVQAAEAKPVATPSATAPTASTPPPVAAPQAQTLPAHEPATKKLDQLPYASPSVRKLAREFGVPLAEVKGSGNKGRITAKDIQGFVAQVLSGQIRTQAQQSSGAGGVGLDLLPWPTVLSLIHI